MTELSISSQLTNRDSSFAIIKAIAVLFVVVAHSGGPAGLVNAASIFSMPVFFICAGYFFNLKYLDAPKTYIWHRVCRVYWPFWGWSVAFLILHNFFFWIGILSEKSSHVLGGVAHTYSWHEFFQHLWNITFSMSGYDPFLAETFWFFRTLFISSIAFFLLFLLIQKFSRWRSPQTVAGMILGLSLGLAAWMVLGDLQIEGVAQGGYRELLALAFMSVGFLYRTSQHRWRPRGLVAGLGVAVLILFTWWSPSSMGHTADFVDFVALPLPAIGAFLALHVFADGLAEKDHFLTRSLVYVGDRMLYVLAFHLLAFKLVSVIKVLTYGLPWSHVGGYPVVQDHPGDLFFLLYILAGVALPLGVVAGWKKMDETYDLTWLNCLKYTGKGILAVLNFLKNIILKLLSKIWKSIMGLFQDLKGFIKASNPRDE